MTKPECEDEQTADPRPAGERDGLGQSIPEGEQPPGGLETQGASGMGSPAGTPESMSDPIKALAESSAWCAKHMEEIERLRAFIESRGYRRCDIMVCNCDSFHGGHAEARLGEIDEALPDANGPTLLQRVQELRTEVERLKECACAGCLTASGVPELHTCQDGWIKDKNETLRAENEQLRGLVAEMLAIAPNAHTAKPGMNGHSRAVYAKAREALAKGGG